jgi:hypothetical protein
VLRACSCSKIPRVEIACNQRQSEEGIRRGNQEAIHDTHLLEDPGLVGAAQLDDGDGVSRAARGVLVIVILLELGIRVVDDDQSGASAQGVLECASARLMRRAQLAPVEAQPVNASVLCSLVRTSHAFGGGELVQLPPSQPGAILEEDISRADGGSRAQVGRLAGEQFPSSEQLAGGCARAAPSQPSHDHHEAGSLGERGRPPG